MEPADQLWLTQLSGARNKKASRCLDDFTSQQRLERLRCSSFNASAMRCSQAFIKALRIVPIWHPRYPSHFWIHRDYDAVALCGISVRMVRRRCSRTPGNSLGTRCNATSEDTGRTTKIPKKVRLRKLRVWSQMRTTKLALC
jgi:hypothetical protein